MSVLRDRPVIFEISSTGAWFNAGTIFATPAAHEEEFKALLHIDFYTSMHLGTKL